MTENQKRTWIRLFTAASISLGCFGGTYFWYHSTDKTGRTDSNQKPLAFAERTRDEIHRRPVTRLIWQLVNDGEPLYPGEAIRTSSIGEVRIQFTESDRFIDLEPDSLIVISQSKNEISLELMDGSFLVNQGAKDQSDGPALTLNSANGKVDLSTATASLSKSSSGIDLQVLKGKAKVESNGQIKEIETGKSGALNSKGMATNQDNLVALAPGLETFVNPENLQPITFKWKGQPPGSAVSIMTGPTQKKLKESGSIIGSEYLLKLTPAKYYWRLVAKDVNSKATLIESPLFRLDVRARFAPSMISPADEAKIVPTPENSAIEFKWTMPDKIKSIYLEVAKDGDFNEKIFSKNFFNEDSVRQALPLGNYFWRLSATFDGMDKPIFSKVQKFRIDSGAPAQPVITIGWINPDEKTPQYFVDQPIASLGWISAQKEKVRSWRLKLAEKEEDINTPAAQVFDTKELSLKTKVGKPGRYIAMVEALDEKSQVVATSPLKTVEVAPLPLLEAPKFDPAEGEMLADNQGRLELKWNSVDGAKQYELTLIGADGKPMRTAKFAKTSTALVNLLPGTYRVAIVAVDEHGRPGLKDLPRTVKVPDGSGLGAPKLKKIKVN